MRANEMSAANARHRNQKRPGLIQAANALGCSYSHLYRVTVTGERQSRSLMRKFRAWQRANKATQQESFRRGLKDVRRAVDFVERTLTQPPH
jgi:hypothetical protein